MDDYVEKQNKKNGPTHYMAAMTKHAYSTKRLLYLC